MAKPVVGDWQKLVRLGGYLKGSPRCVLEYQWQSSGNAPRGYSDSDWAGDRTIGKNTSGGIVMPGAHLVKSWSRTQESVTLSFAEAELVTLGRLAMETLDFRTMCQEWKLTPEGISSPLYADASAASRRRKGRERYATSTLN